MQYFCQILQTIPPQRKENKQGKLGTEPNCVLQRKKERKKSQLTHQKLGSNNLSITFYYWSEFDLINFQIIQLNPFSNNQSIYSLALPVNYIITQFFFSTLTIYNAYFIMGLLCFLELFLTCLQLFSDLFTGSVLVLKVIALFKVNLLQVRDLSLKFIEITSSMYSLAVV